MITSRFQIIIFILNAKEHKITTKLINDKILVTVTLKRLHQEARQYLEKYYY